MVGIGLQADLITVAIVMLDQKVNSNEVWRPNYSYPEAMSPTFTVWEPSEVLMSVASFLLTGG